MSWANFYSYLINCTSLSYIYFSLLKYQNYKIQISPRSIILINLNIFSLHVPGQTHIPKFQTEFASVAPTEACRHPWPATKVWDKSARISITQVVSSHHSLRHERSRRSKTKTRRSFTFDKRVCSVNEMR